MKRLVALREVYCGKTHHAGDSFEASELDAKLHVALGNARLEDLPPTAAPPQTLRTTTMRPAPVTENTGKRRGKYKTRDMRAED